MDANTHASEQSLQACLTSIQRNSPTKVASRATLQLAGKRSAQRLARLFIPRRVRRRGYHSTDARFTTPEHPLGGTTAPDHRKVDVWAAPFLVNCSALLLLRLFDLVPVEMCHRQPGSGFCETRGNQVRLLNSKIHRKVHYSTVTIATTSYNAFERPDTAPPPYNPSTSALAIRPRAACAVSST
jgi:hypothetical protein